MKIGLIAAAFAVCATAASAQTLTVSGEEGITYTVVEVSNGQSVKKKITTLRSGDGTSTYTIHGVNCDPYRAGVMATASNLDDLNDNVDQTPEMLEIIRFSAEDVIAGYACDN